MDICRVTPQTHGPHPLRLRRIARRLILGDGRLDCSTIGMVISQRRMHLHQ